MIAILLALLACGEQRWDIKVASDREAVHIDPRPLTSTIEEIRAREPRPFANHAPRWPEEMQTLVVEALLDGFMREDDGDYHVGIRDEQGRSMVVEFPDPKCLKKSHLRAEATAARKAIEDILRVPITAKYKRLQTNTVRLRVTGVFFWDKKHGQHLGARSPNGAELHLVRSVTRLP